MFKRTHTCGELTSSNVDQTTSLNGWVYRTRDHGGLIFIDLRDRYGITQIKFDENDSKEAFLTAKALSIEDVISVKGTVVSRDSEAINKELLTGEIEVNIESIIILNESKPLPFMISDREGASEETRLKYRYLELRTDQMQKNMLIRHKTYQEVRKYLSSNDFIEFETPVLMRATPEGARDFLVPSRLHKGQFYALPQSPQQYKQILMVSGFDRYFQIVKCFRDEDFRADRQPEFTQIDIEMSFIDESDIKKSVEELVCSIFKNVINYELKNQNIYGQHIKEYRDFATVQTLLNDWRQRGDFKRIVEYESKVHDMLLREDVHVNLESEKDAEVDQLVLKIMTEKFNKKYGLTFNEQQQSLIKEYVFSSKSNPERFETTLESIKEKTIDSLTRFEALCENEYVKNKISPVLDEVKSLSTSNINDETISKFLTVYQLQKELTGDYDG